MKAMLHPQSIFPSLPQGAAAITGRGTGDTDALSIFEREASIDEIVASFTEEQPSTDSDMLHMSLSPEHATTATTASGDTYTTLPLTEDDSVELPLATVARLASLLGVDAQQLLASA